MSNNAVAAYEEGKKPLSKWSKSKILDSLCVSEEEKEKLKKYCLDTLRQYFLRYSEWHHTSSHYNCTDFYEVVVPDRIDYKTLDASEAFYRECILCALDGTEMEEDDLNGGFYIVTEHPTTPIALLRGHTYSSIDDIIAEFKSYAGDYLPEDFNWMHHVGTLYYSIWE